MEIDAKKFKQHFNKLTTHEEIACKREELLLKILDELLPLLEYRTKDKCFIVKKTKLSSHPLLNMLKA